MLRCVRLLSSRSPLVLPTVSISLVLLAACAPASTPPPSTPTVVTTDIPAQPAVAHAPVTYHCDGAAFRAGGRDYCAYATPVSWEAAKKACSMTGAQLASFATQEKSKDLFAALGPSIPAIEALWIGLEETGEGAWTWVDQTPFGFSRWNDGEPNNDGGEEQCGEWKLGNGTWNDAPCFASRGFICEKKSSTKGALTCPGQHITTSSGDYCFHVSDPREYQEAKAACEATGATLAVLSSSAENKALYSAVGPKLGLLSVWVGYSDTLREGVWRWVSNEPGQYALWKPGEPNDFKDDEDCAEWFAEDGRMNDLSCEAKRPYLCERVDKR